MMKPRARGGGGASSVLPDVVVDATDARHNAFYASHMKSRGRAERHR